MKRNLALLTILLWTQIYCIFADEVFNCTISSDQVFALEDLLNSTNGNNWNPNCDWDFSQLDSNPCSSEWYGITCAVDYLELNGTDCEWMITSLDLSYCNLDGTIPESIGQLQFLVTLILLTNSIYGTLPESLGDLTNLEHLALNGNSLTGKIPESIGNLTYLEYLNLAANRLSDSIPESIGELPNLGYLALSHNELSGSIPESMGDLTNLFYMSLSDNSLIGTIPESLGNLERLGRLYLSFNKLTGGIPENISSMVNLQILDLYANEVSGSIPDSIGELFSLTKLYLSFNKLTGNIPESIGSLTNLQYWECYWNKLSGSIPESIGDLTLLKYLGLSYNQLSGSIPEKIGGLSSLEDLYLVFNQLNGSIPSSFENLTHLQTLDLSDNEFSAYIPENIGDLANLEYLDLSRNGFSGMIPESIFDLINLQTLDLSNNILAETIPESIGELAALQYLYLYYNELSSSIPESIGNLSSVIEINLSQNELTGSIPVTIGDTFSLEVLDLSNNKLFGSLPESIGKLFNLRELVLPENALSGSIPEIDDLFNVVKIHLFTNKLTGRFPDLIGDLLNLEQLILFGNELTGTIPESVGNLTNLGSFDVSNNELSGTIPEKIFDLVSMVDFGVESNHLSGGVVVFSSFIFTAQHNLFTGPLVFINSESVLVDASNNQFTSIGIAVDELASLQSIDVSENQITGTLPVKFFGASLNFFSATRNCFYGSVPLEICNAQSLVTLSLNGVGTASSCRLPIFPAISSLSSFTTTHVISGGIPECLFELPSIETLHLSGNSIEWSFPTEFDASESLKFISLSHNRISGTIPDLLLITDISGVNVDLSYNRIGGTIYPDISLPADATLILEVNRLSGNIPHSLLHLAKINILTGSLLSCEMNGDGLPVHDKAYSYFQCGSNSFNQSSIMWCVAVGIALIAAFVMFRYYYLQYVVQLWRLYLLEFSDVKGNSGLHSLGQFLFLVRDIVNYWTLFILVVLLPVYASLTHYYGTTEYQYAWTVSAGFLSGFKPAIILLVFYSIFLGLLLAIWTLVELNEIQVANNSTGKPLPASSWSQVSVLSLMTISNSVIMCVMNGAYVYATLTCSSSVLFFIQIVMAVFKLLWNDVVVKEMVMWSRRLYQSALEETLFAYFQVADTQSFKDGNIKQELNDIFDLQEMPYMTFIVLFNNIIAPCLATTAVDSSCFYNVFVAPDPVFSTVATVDKNGNEVFTTRSYDPPFIYSYQCTSSMLTNYASVYVFMYLLVGFVKPAVVFAMAMYFDRIPKGSRVEMFIHKNAFNLLRPAEEEQLNSGKALLRKDRFVLRYLGKICVFLTFGVVFPPLAVMLCVAFLAETYLNTLLVGKFLVDIKDPMLYVRFKERLNKDAQGIVELLMAPLVRSVFPFVAIFYGFFVFDTYGDEVGVKKAIWMPIFLLVWTLVVWYCCAFYLTLFAKSTKQVCKETKIEVEIFHDGVDYYY